MGFAKYYEDLQDRYWENAPDWPDHARAAAPPPAPDPFDRPRRAIHEFWLYYTRHGQIVEAPAGRWEEHFQNVQALHDLLTPVMAITEADPGAWDLLCSVERQVRDFFRAAREYGPLSRGVVEAVARVSRDIRARCAAVERELSDFWKQVRAMPEEERAARDLLQTVTQLREIGERLNADFKARRAYDGLAREVEPRWEQFLRLRSLVAVQGRYRPAWQHLDRLHLNEQQERFVALDHMGEYRIQGASGSGKTIILIHRALRLAAEEPGKTVRVFTLNRSLAELLRSSLAAVGGGVPANLQVAALYDFLFGCVGLFEPTDKSRLVDDCSGERIALSCHDFYHHRGPDETRNVFASPSVRDLIRSIGEREALAVDACRYLRDEMVYVQSAFRLGERYGYLTAPRAARSIPLMRVQRSLCLAVLDAWAEWLRCGDLCDVDGLTLRVAEEAARDAVVSENERLLEEVRQGAAGRAATSCSAPRTWTAGASSRTARCRPAWLCRGWRR